MCDDYIFKDYRKEKPQIEGWYAWRLPHKFIGGVVLIFLAKFRKRGAGFEQVLSPEFDYWDGYNVLLPKGPIEWSEYNGDAPRPGYELLEIVNINNVKCAFCKTEPIWKYSSRYIGSGPTDTNYFYLECCRWFNGFGSRMQNPFELTKQRNIALSNK